MKDVGADMFMFIFMFICPIISFVDRAAGTGAQFSSTTEAGLYVAGAAAMAPLLEQGQVLPASQVSLEATSANAGEAMATAARMTDSFRAAIVASDG